MSLLSALVDVRCARTVKADGAGVRDTVAVLSARDY